MNSIVSFQEMLKLRAIFKRVSQVSWNIAQIEQRFPFDRLDDQSASELKQAYIQDANEVIQIARDLGEYEIER